MTPTLRSLELRPSSPGLRPRTQDTVEDSWTSGYKTHSAHKLPGQNTDHEGILYQIWISSTSRLSYPATDRSYNKVHAVHVQYKYIKLPLGLRILYRM